MENQNQYQRIVSFILFILALILLFFLVRPLITILLSSILLAYVTFPLYSKIFKKIPRKTLAIILSLLIVFLLILIPFSLLAFEISQKGFSLYNSFSSNIEKGALFGVGCISEDSKICSIINQAEKFNSEQLSKIGFDKQMKKFLEYIGERITEFILKIPLIIAEIFLMIVLAYYILADWENLLAKISDLLPMRDKTKNRLTKQFGDITHTVIYGQLFVALVQGMAGAIGFYVLGIPFPIMLGVLLGLFSFIPAIGTALIWVPASLYLILSGYFAHSPWILVKGIILFLYGLLVIGTIDNFLLARIVHKRAKVSPIIVIIGVIGGAGLFGVPGIFIGPILLPLLITYFKTFKEKFE